MFRLVLVLGLIAAAHGLGRIVGGKDAKIEDFNHQASLRLYSSHRCGASLVTSKVLVTAAHCVYGYTSSPQSFSVKAGSDNRLSGGDIHDVEVIHQHKSYNNRNLDYDVAILIVKSPFKFSDKIGVVSLVEKNSVIEVGTVSHVTGWGATRQGGGGSTILQVVEVPYIDRDVCADQYYNYDVTERMSCWGYPAGGKDACQGDSGGPLVIHDASGGHVLAGVVSWGVGCAKPNQPGVYADVTNQDVHDFITQYI